MGPFLGFSVCLESSLVFGIDFIYKHRDSSSMGRCRFSFGLGENKCYGLGLGFGLSIVSFKNETI